MGLRGPSRTAMWLVSVLTGVLGTSRNGRGVDSWRVVPPEVHRERRVFTGGRPTCVRHTRCADARKAANRGATAAQAQVLAGRLAETFLGCPKVSKVRRGGPKTLFIPEIEISTRLRHAWLSNSLRHATAAAGELFQQQATEQQLGLVLPPKRRPLLLLAAVLSLRGARHGWRLNGLPKTAFRSGLSLCWPVSLAPRAELRDGRAASAR